MSGNDLRCHLCFSMLVGVIEIQMSGAALKLSAKRRSVSFFAYSAASVAASNAKRANRKKDSKHEVLLRAELRKLGLRYRKYGTAIVGSPDIVFFGARVAVFCDGDFWHGRNWRQLRRALAKRHNPEYWIAKIKANRARDRSVNGALTRQGWEVIRFWESEILRSPHDAAELILAVVKRNRSTSATKKRR